MKSSKMQNIYLGAAAAAATLLAFFGFMSASGREPAQRVLFIICSLLLVVLVALYVYIIMLSQDREPNYFLYDKKSRRNIGLSELNWSIISERLAMFISEKLDNEHYLWSENLLTAENKYGYKGVFRPLVAYKMLCDLATDNSGEYFKLFQNASPHTITALCRIIENTGDGQDTNTGESDMAAAILSYKTHGGTPENFLKYLSANRRYIQGRMLAYVRRHIEYFY